MNVTKRTYKLRNRKNKVRSSSATLPNQAMSVNEIVKRFVRGVPVGVVKREPIYVDQNDMDLEKVSRMDFGEQYEMAEQFRNRAASIADNLKARQERMNEQANEDEEEEPLKKPQKKAAKKRTGIDTLDNTMPVDTDAEN